ncbi:NACHT domain-containing protein [Deinococcus aetherius]|uniref:NACHT domain-containing protein n=1 Tax=Deinococcus aetherius TaxID=200252 RepID=UPI0031F03E66
MFEQHDSGVALTDAGRVHAPSLRERFILPDILDAPPGSLPASRPPRPDEEEPETEHSPEARRRRREVRTVRPSADTRRRGLEGWLVEHDAHVILGGPGSGKSTLLRFVTLDLLDDAPELGQVAGRWGQHLPVWVPFAFWTRVISFEGEGTISLHEVMGQWLRAFNAQDLAPLIDRALDDGRLLLVVDGLDEYVRSDYGELALDRLRVFVQQRGVPVLLSSRPDGYKLFKAKLSGWADGHIADLSEAQQRRLAEIWFAHQLRNADEDLGDDAVVRRTAAEVEAFFEELRDSPDLAHLAAVPLLLCLLVALRRAEVALPRSRFRVYEEVVKHLLEAHPRRRRRAAAMGDDDHSLSPLETRQALERLAYEMHCAHPEGVISIDTASEVVAAYLQDDEVGLGLGRREARTSAARLVAVGETNSGLLVGRSPHEAGFFHRSLQEFLAAGYLSRLDDQLEVVRSRRLDAQWREVLLGTLHFTRLPQQARKLLDVLRAPGGTVAQRQHLAHLLAEAAFGEFPVPPAVAQELAHDTLAAIERETWVPQRERLLGHALDGLQSAKVRDLVHERLRRWFPERLRYRSSALEAMGTWPLEEETVALLFQGLHEEEASERIAAAKALAALGNQQPGLFEQLARVARQAHSVEAQAGALHALVLGWPEALDLSEMLDHHAASPHPEHRLLAYTGLAKQGRLTDMQLNDTLSFRGYGGGISYTLRDLVVDVLVQGWPGDPRVREACLPGGSQAGMDRELNWQVLLRGFSSDPQVLGAVGKEIRGEKPPFLGVSNAWPLLLRHFRDAPAVMLAIDARLEGGDLGERDLFFASLVRRTALAKTKLLGSLDDGFRHWPVHALLEGWGMDDPEVAPRLLALATGPDDVAASIGFLIPDIMRDADAARQRLLPLLRDPECARPDFVLSGLAKVGVGEVGPAMLDAAFPHLGRPRGLGYGGLDHVLQFFPQEPRMLEYARQLLEEGAEWAGSVAYHLRHDAAIRQAVRDRSMPLDPGSRFVIASKLRQRWGDPQEVLGLLEAHNEEGDPETRVQCAISLALRARAEGRELTPIVELFVRDASTPGIGGNTGLQAGIAGLLTLGELGAVTAEVHGRRITEWIHPLLETSFDTAGNFVATVAQHWEEVREVVGPALFKGREENAVRVSSLAALAAYAEGSPLMSRQLLQVIEQHRSLRRSPAILQFLGRVLPGSGLLLEACLDALEEENSYRDTPLAAAQLLGKHFGGSGPVPERLTTALGEMPPREDVLMALTEGWPDSLVVREAYDWYAANKASASYPLYFRLAGLHSTPEKLIEALKATFEHCASVPKIASESIVPPLVRRLRHDPAFGAALATWLTTDRHPSALATVPRLLARAGVLSDELRKWCTAEVERLSGEDTTAPLGIDLLAGRVRPVLHSLLDAI